MRSAPGSSREADLPTEQIDCSVRPARLRIDALVQDIVEQSREAGDIAQSEEMGGAMLRLRKFMFHRVYLGAEARSEHERVIRTLHDAVRSLPRPSRAEFRPTRTVRIDLQRVTDYVAGMTDRFCIATFRRIALPEESRL